ncbi:MAG: hypothetical protein ACYSO4_05245, partial [Planctomycetota bacterium]
LFQALSHSPNQFRLFPMEDSRKSEISEKMNRDLESEANPPKMAFMIQKNALSADLTDKAKSRPKGLEPSTFGSTVRQAHSLTNSKPRSYEVFKNDLIANLTENPNAIQSNLAKIINQWPSLSSNIKTAIMVLVGGNDE